MQLITFTYAGSHRLGRLDDGAVVDLNAAYAAYLREVRGLRYDADRVADALLPPDMVGLLRRESEALEAVERAVDYVRERREQGEVPPDPRGRPVVLPRDQVALAAPLPNPPKLICIGLNYIDHCREQGVEPPDHPVIFSKYSNAVIGPDATIRLPRASEQVDYEAELAFVIGRRARNVSAAEADAAVAGYTIVNDVSARDIQFADGQWVRGKTPDTFAPMGPALVTADEVGDPHTLDIALRLNGETLQDSNTENLIFRVPDLIAFISQTMTLEPGDVISTGTPPGVGVFREPPVFLSDGDVVEVAIERLGVLTNPVEAE